MVKAWYRHNTQHDQVALIKGELLLVLYDSREPSPTSSNIQKIAITEQEPLLVQIPPGIWHGFKALGVEPSYLIHLNSIAFNFEQTDEDRLPLDTVLIPHQWEG